MTFWSFTTSEFVVTFVGDVSVDAVESWGKAIAAAAATRLRKYGIYIMKEWKTKWQREKCAILRRKGRVLLMEVFMKKVR